MAKRKLSKQQQRRIASIQKNKIKNEQHADNNAQLEESNTQTVRVISHHGRQLYAETADLKKIKCKIRQNLGDIACGDYVLVQQSFNHSDTKPGEPTSAVESQNVVVAVKERTNLFVKTGFAGAIKPVEIGRASCRERV